MSVYHLFEEQNNDVIKIEKSFTIANSQLPLEEQRHTKNSKNDPPLIFWDRFDSNSVEVSRVSSTLV